MYASAENIGTIMWAFDGDLNKYPGFLNLSDDQKGLIEAMVLLTGMGIFGHTAM